MSRGRQRADVDDRVRLDVEARGRMPSGESYRCAAGMEGIVVERDGDYLKIRVGKYGAVVAAVQGDVVRLTKKEAT